MIGAFYLLTASLLFTAMDVTIKLTVSQLSPWQIGFGRFAFGTVVTYLLARMTGRSVWGKRRGKLILRGVTGTIQFVCMIIALGFLPLSLALIIFFTFPALAALLAPLFTNERADGPDWVLIAAAFAGIGLIMWPTGGGIQPGWGHLLALTAAVSAAVAVNLIRDLTADNGSLTLYFYFCLVGAVVCVLPLLGGSGPVLPTDQTGSWGLLAVAGLAMVGQLMMNRGFKYLPAHQGGVLLMTEVAFGSLVGVLFLGDDLGARELAGAIMICGSGAALTWRAGQKRRRLKAAA